MAVSKKTLGNIEADIRSKEFSLEEIADRNEVSTTFVRSVAVVNGLSFENKRTIERRRMAEWIKNNKASKREAALHFKCNPLTIETACAENGVELRVDKAKESGPTTAFKILAKLMDGRAVEDVAKAMGVSRQRVDQVKQHAIEARIIGSRSLFLIEVKNAKAAK